MKSGFEFLKHGKRGKPHKRLVWFELDKGAICWTVCLGFLYGVWCRIQYQHFNRNVARRKSTRRKE